jgi:hypothetical protein
MVEREPQLARGRKRKLSDTLTNLVESALKEWRDTELFELFYGEGSRNSSAFGGLPSRMLLGDDVIERIAGGGRRVSTGEDLAKVTRWSLAHTTDGSLSKYGVTLLEQLARVYRQYDDSLEEREVASRSSISEVPPEQFYGRPKPTRHSQVESPPPVASASPPPVASGSTQPMGSTEGQTLRRSTRIKK